MKMTHQRLAQLPLFHLVLVVAWTSARGQAAPTLDVPAFDSLGQLTLKLQGTAGAGYAIDVSRDMSFWVPLTSGSAADGHLAFQYLPGANTRALYFRGRLDTKLPPIKVTPQPDANNQTMTLITPEDGGSLSLLDANGITYTLTVPPQTVSDSEVVTMMVVTNATGLPFASGWLGGVTFTPHDVQFTGAARFTIQFPTNLTSETQAAVGYAFDSDGSYLRLLPALPDTNNLVLPILDLSGLGCSVATWEEIQQQARRSVSDTNNIAAPGPYYDSCYPAEKTRAVFVNKGLENALRRSQQDTGAKLDAIRQAVSHGDDLPSIADLGLQTLMNNFYRDNLAQYADELKTNCALASVIISSANGLDRQATLLGLSSPIPDSFMNLCNIFGDCAKKIGDCCKRMGPSQEALVELLGLVRESALLCGENNEVWKHLGDCYPGWSGTITYEDANSHYESIAGGETDWQYHLTVTFIATNLLGEPTGEGYYGVNGTVTGQAEGKSRVHSLNTGGCCYCYDDSLRTSAIKTNVSALFQLVWAITNVPPPPQGALLLFPEPDSLATLAAVDALNTFVSSSGGVDCKSPIYSIETAHGTDPYPLQSLQYNSTTITGTLDQVTGSYTTNWTDADGTQNSRMVSWDLHRESGP